MIHRYIHHILTTGVALYKADTRLVDDLFQELYELETTEIAAIKTYFLANGLNVYNGYPRRDSKIPYVAIILAQETESETFIGDYAGMITEDGHALYGADVEGSIWNHVFHLPIVSEHPDVTSYYYELVKTLLLVGLRYLTDQECFQFSFSGMDLAPDPKYIPEHLFVRQLVFSCQRQFSRIDRDSRLTKAFQVAGIHIDSSGSPSDVGGVETLVTPYTVGDDDAET
jgi:hypothetical protein